ncbi:MAG: hypothetical protein ACRDVE_10500 [Actinocrinis sp.]
MTAQTPGLKDLVARAASDEAFASRLLTEPESVAGEYGLTDDQVAKIRDLAGAGLLQPAVEAHLAPVQGGGTGYY